MWPWGCVKTEGMSFSNVHNFASYWVFLLSSSALGVRGDSIRWAGYLSTKEAEIEWMKDEDRMDEEMVWDPTD